MTHVLRLAHATTRAIQRWSTPLAFLLLAAVTVYYFRGLQHVDWFALGAVLRTKRHLAVLAMAANLAAVALDYIAWQAAWRAQGIRFTGPRAFALFLAPFALQFVPMQLGRFARVTLAFRAGRAALREGTTAEAVYFALDLLALVMLLLTALAPATLALPLLAAALAAGPVALALGDAFHGVIARRFASLSSHGLLCAQNVGLYLGRLASWALTATVLYFAARMTTPTVDWSRASVSAWGASFAGGLSSLPGGLGVNEAVLAAGLRGQIPGFSLEEGLTILTYRLLTFWMWFPVGWVGLWYFRRMKKED